MSPTRASTHVNQMRSVVDLHRYRGVAGTGRGVGQAGRPTPESHAHNAGAATCGCASRRSVNRTRHRPHRTVADSGTTPPTLHGPAGGPAGGPRGNAVPVPPL